MGPELRSGSSGWSQTFTYDGFGNLYNKTGTGGAPSWSGTIDAATNRLSGPSYDANGNQTFAPMTAGMPDAFNMTYDAANRMVYSENPTQSRTSEYHYDAGNKRVYEKRFDGGTQEWVYFFGVTGQRLARYTFTVSGSAITFTQDTASVWFGGKLVQKVNSLGSTYAYEDRLGSVGKYLPYGEDKPGATNPANDNEKFATYTRDANTGIDYADQRWHAQGTGRFLTADPYRASAGPGDPGSWNRYGYVRGDPANRIDRSGLLDEGPPPLPNFSVCPDGRLTFFYGPTSNACDSTPFYNQPIGVMGPEQLRTLIAGLKVLGATSKYRPELQKTLANLSANCKKSLEEAGVDLDKLKSDADKIVFVDSTDSSLGSFTLAEVMGMSGPVPASYNQTVSGFSGSGQAQMIPGATSEYQGTGTFPVTRYMVLEAGFFDPGFAFQQGRLLLHELLHYNMQMTDQQLLFALTGDPADLNRTQAYASNQINVELATRGCR